MDNNQTLAPVEADGLDKAADPAAMDSSSMPDKAVEPAEQEDVVVTTDEATADMEQQKMDEADLETVPPENNGDDTEDSVHSIPTASEDAIQSLSDQLNTAGLQYHTETEGCSSQSAPEAMSALSANATDQMNKLEYISSTLFTMHERFGELSKSVAVLSQELQKVSDETERTVKWSESVTITSALSRLFLVLCIVVLIALLGGMSYLAVNQYQLQQQQSSVAKLVASEVEVQSKRMAEFDKHFAELVGGEIKNERESISKDSIMSKLNKLRGGISEQRILRKSSGDWLIPTGKNEELITDHDTIEALNQAFEKSGRPLITPPSLPPHKVVSILKPDGKGGTSVVVTRETVP